MGGEGGMSDGGWGGLGVGVLFDVDVDVGVVFENTVY